MGWDSRLFFFGVEVFVNSVPTPFVYHDPGCIYSRGGIFSDFHSAPSVLRVSFPQGSDVRFVNPA